MRSPNSLAAGWTGAWANAAYSASTLPEDIALADKTHRTVVRLTTATGAMARIRLTNVGAPTPVTFDAASIAA